MTLSLILLTLVALAALATAALLVRRSHLQVGPSILGETVVAHTTDDRSIRGVVVGMHADRLILRDAVLLVDVGASSAVPGLCEIPTRSLSWWQRVVPAGG